MKKVLKELRNKLPFYHTIRNRRMVDKHKREMFEWESVGCPAPPPHLVKQRVLKEYAEKYDLKILVETGTKFGDMVYAMKDVFDTIYSIELGQDLHEHAKRRFRKERNIILIQGDSAEQLENLVEELDQPVLFWLDGHYSGGVTAMGSQVTPIFKELNYIFRDKNPGHVIIIDDARLFRSDPDYPSMDELYEFINSKANYLQITEEHDSIRIVPKKEQS